MIPGSTNGDTGDWLDLAIKMASETTSEEHAAYWANRREFEVHTNERTDAVNNLELATDWLEAAELDPQRMWKWAIIGVHGATQGFLVLALKGTWDVSTLTPKKRSTKLQALDEFHKRVAAGKDDAHTFELLSRSIDPSGNLATVPDLYTTLKKWVGSPNCPYYSPDFNPEATDDDCIRRLHAIRGEQSHHRAMPFSYLKTELVAVAEAGLRLIDFLLEHSNLITWHPEIDEPDLERRTNEALARAKNVVERLTATYSDMPRQRTPLCGSWLCADSVRTDKATEPGT
jgi:hypothetical protein